MFCPSCGTENHQGREYCDRCGERVAAPDPERIARTDLAKCARCGTVNHIRAPHCIGCGVLQDQTTAIALSTISEAPPRPTPRTPRPQEQPRPAAPPRAEARPAQPRESPRPTAPPQREPPPRAAAPTPPQARDQSRGSAERADRPDRAERSDRGPDTRPDPRFGAPTGAPKAATEPDTSGAASTGARGAVRVGPFVNDSGSPNAVLPEELKGWNWGAFLWGMIGFAPIWGYFNRVWIALLMGLVWLSPIAPTAFRAPLIVGGLILTVYLGFKGNELVWRGRRWENAEHFRRVQQGWVTWGLLIAVVQILVYLIFLYMARNN